MADTKWEERWRRIADQAQLQHGVVSRAQLRRAGFTAGTIDRAVVSGRLHPVFRGTYGVGYPPQHRNALLFAATLAGGEDTVVSHGTAAALLGLWEQPPEEIDVIAPVEAGRKIAGIRRRFVPPPAPEESWMHAGIPCTSPGRTIVDVASLAARPIPAALATPTRTSRAARTPLARADRAIRDTIEQAAVRRMFNVPEIDRVLDGPRRRGSSLLLGILDLWRRYPPGLVIRSPMEARLLPLLTEFAVPMPKVNEKLRLGNERFEIDFLWRRARLAVETDGSLVHGTPEAASRDAHRDQALRSAGFRVWRLAWDQVAYSPEQTMHELIRLIRDPRRSPPDPPASCSFPSPTRERNS